MIIKTTNINLSLCGMFDMLNFCIKKYKKDCIDFTCWGLLKTLNYKYNVGCMLLRFKVSS